MNITAAKISGKEIHEKYPILNIKWKYSYEIFDVNGYNGLCYTGNNGYYYSNYKDWSTEVVTDPWYRNLINNGNPINTTESESIFFTTVDGNKIILIIYLKAYV
jgi:hypothetical protein